MTTVDRPDNGQDELDVVDSAALAGLWPYCGHRQDEVRPGWLPYRCTKVHGHDGDHAAVVDCVTVARWPR